MIPVKITRPVYIRKGPGPSHEKLGVAQPSGRTILMDGVIENGETHKGISKHYYKINEKGEKQWYWSGRVEEIEKPLNVQDYLNERFDGQNITQLLNYNFLLNIDESIKINKGNGATIGILDQPISKNIEFKNRVVRPLNISQPAGGHGNFIAGLIAANSSKINGISPFSTIVELSLFNEIGDLIADDDFEKLITCIKSFPSKVIINVSRTGIKVSDTILKRFESLVNVVFVCAAGGDDKLKDIEQSECFLPNNANTIIVGCLSPEFSSKSNEIDKRVDVVFPVLDYVSFTTNGLNFLPSTDDTSSWATAVVSSIIALLFSTGIINNNSTIQKIKTEILKQSKSYNGNNIFLNPIII